MDKLIIDLYKQNIIQIKQTRLKNGIMVPFIIDIYKIFDNRHILDRILEELNNIIINECIQVDYLMGLKDIPKNISTLLSYKYKYSNLIETNLKNIDKDTLQKNSCIIIKESCGISNKTNMFIESLNDRNIDVKYIISLVNFNTNINNNYTDKYTSLYLLDFYQILNVLYNNKYIDFDIYSKIYPSLYNTNFHHNNLSTLIKNNNNDFMNNTISEILKKKSCIIFCCNIVQNLQFKDLIKTLDFIGKHVSIIKLNEFDKYNTLEINSIIKLADHHNFKILSEMVYNNTSFVKLININQLLTKSWTIDDVPHIVYDNITINDFTVLRQTIYRKIKTYKNIIGLITFEDEFIQEQKLKIFEIKNLKDNMLEDKLIKYNYDILMINNIDILVSIKQLAWNIYIKKKDYNK